MPKCSFYNCKNITSRTLKKDGVSYFHFPCDPIRREEWISIVAQQRCDEFFKPNKSSVVCSVHFTDEDVYDTTKGIKRLHKTAVPRVEVEIPGDGSNTEVCIPSSIGNRKLIYPSRFLSIGTTLDTYREDILKRELQKCRKRLIARKKIIESLRKKNFRLVKKNISLNNTITDLKERFQLNSNLC